MSKDESWKEGMTAEQIAAAERILERTVEYKVEKLQKTLSSMLTPDEPMSDLDLANLEAFFAGASMAPRLRTRTTKRARKGFKRIRNPSKGTLRYRKRKRVNGRKIAVVVKNA